MLKKMIHNHIAREYALLSLGIIFSTFLSFFKQYINKLNYEFLVVFSINALGITLLYIFFTGYIITIILPIIGKLWKLSYKYFFYFFTSLNFLWFLIFLSDNLLSNILFICFPMPVAYIFAWRVNKKYWRERDLYDNPKGAD